MNKDMTVKNNTDIINIEDTAMSVDKVMAQITLIQNVMKQAMKENEHYGKIPGTNKPTLLKSGAEKLCLTFRLDPHYDIIDPVREKNFIAYTVKCTLTHIPTGNEIASGIGSCNSREKKYRYYSKNTNRPVPKEYWKDRDTELLGGSQYLPRKVNGKWIIYEQIENDNPWDLDNTLVKMACKRALVAATLNATAASDIFTQDIEEMPPELVGGEDTTQPTMDDNTASDVPPTETDHPQNTGTTNDDKYKALLDQLHQMAVKKTIKAGVASKITAQALKIRQNDSVTKGIEFLETQIGAIEIAGEV